MPKTALAGGGGYAELLRRAAEQLPDASALVFPHVRISYGELLGRAEARGRELRALGVRRGDTFGLLLPNSPELIEFLLGGVLIGAITVPINTRFKARELAHVCRDGRLRTVITTDAVEAHVSLKGVLYDALPGLRQARNPTAVKLDGFPELASVAILGEPDDGLVDESQMRLLAEDEREVQQGDALRPEDPILVMYTSGTTANPKGCVTANGALIANANDIAERFEVPSGDRWWDPLPMFHMGAILLMSVIYSRGGTFISMQHFDAGSALDLIAEHDATVLYPLFPTITLELLHHERFPKLSQENIRIVCNVAPRDIQRQIQEAFPRATLISAYGMTELCGSAAYSRLHDTLEQRTTTCGHMLPSFEAKIIDPGTGEEVAPGVAGELIARGPYMFRGYFGDAEQTAAVIDADGYLHTGDHCSIDANGLLSFHGRLKDQLKVGGENVSALEVESFLATHPAIKLAQVVGVPDDRYLEVPAAFIELVPGATLSKEDVIGFCAGQIARFKTPRYVRFVTGWPMSSTKVQKFRLRDQLIAELGKADGDGETENVASAERV